MAASVSPGAILIVRLGAVGDVIRTLPAVSALRKTWPDARISWAVEEPSAPLLEGDPDIDEVLILRRKILGGIARLRGVAPALAHLRGFRATLRARRFDWAIDFQGTIKSALLARASGAARTIGLGSGHAREHSSLLYSDPVRLPGGRAGKMSRTARALALVESLGADVSSPRRTLPVREPAAATARTILERGASRRPWILLFPGTSSAQAFKRYPADLFAHVGDLVAAGSSGTVILGWGPGEESIVEEVRRRMSRAPIVLPRTSLPELAEILRACDLFIGSDTGPLHLAAAVGTRTVAIYGPTDATINAAESRSPGVAIAGDVVCRPCRWRGCLNRSCLRLIDPAVVAERALDLLNHDSAATPPSEARPLLLVSGGSVRTVSDSRNQPSRAGGPRAGDRRPDATAPGSGAGAGSALL
jgi:lipopolysaccharide heptosyltransferase I